MVARWQDKQRVGLGGSPVMGYVIVSQSQVTAVDTSH